MLKRLLEEEYQQGKTTPSIEITPQTSNNLSPRLKIAITPNQPLQLLQLAIKQRNYSTSNLNLELGNDQQGKLVIKDANLLALPFQEIKEYLETMLIKRLCRFALLNLNPSDLEADFALDNQGNLSVTLRKKGKK